MRDGYEISQDGKADPLKHRCYMTSGRVGFISYFDSTDLVVIVMSVYVANIIASKLFENPAAKLFIIIGVTFVVWTLNFAIKKRLMPYPRIFEHAFSWWFGGVDYYEPDVDPNPVPLIVTREMQVSQATTDAARLVRVRRQRRAVKGSKRVQTQEQE